MRKCKRGQVHHHKIFVAVVLVMSSLYVFSTAVVEAAVALPKPLVTVVSSLTKVGESKKVVIVATAIAPNGNPVEKLSVTLDGKTQSCTKSYYCRVSFGPFKITKNKVFNYTATATYKTGGKNVSAVQKKSLTVVKEKNVLPASVVPVAPVILDQNPVENIPVEVNVPKTSNNNSNANNSSATGGQNNAGLTGGVVGVKDSQKISDLKILQTALELYYKDNSTYPAGSGIVLGIGDYVCLNSDGWGEVGCPFPYIAIVPKDPSGDYIYNFTGTGYTVDAQLEGAVEGLSGKIRLKPSGIIKL